MAKIVTSSKYVILGPLNGYFAFKSKEYDELLLVKDAKYVDKITGKVTHIKGGELDRLKSTKTI